MTTQQEFLLSITGKLSVAGILYMITGSYGSMFHGEPRATNDVDIVIAPTADQIQKFTQLLDEHHYVDLETARTAVADKSMFNVIDINSGWKVDLIVRKSRPFSIEEFNRRTAVDFMGNEVFVVSPEDVILSKLEWSKKGQSEQQLRDVESVAVIQWDNLGREMDAYRNDTPAIPALWPGDARKRECYSSAPADRRADARRRTAGNAPEHRVG